MPVRLLFLDRDGTLNRTFGSRPPNAPHEVTLLPGVQERLEHYAAEGWQLAVITNQGGVAAGYLTEEQAHAVLQRTIDLLGVPVAGIDPEEQFLRREDCTMTGQADLLEFQWHFFDAF